MFVAVFFITVQTLRLNDFKHVKMHQPRYERVGLYLYNLYLSDLISINDKSKTVRTGACWDSYLVCVPSPVSK